MKLFKDLPSTDTPINPENLNQIQDNLVVVSETEPAGDNREKVWIQKTDTDKKMFIKNDNDVYEEFISKDISVGYSTNETKIGTWRDGKPLYRKIIEATAPNTNANGTYVQSATSIANNIDNAFVEFAYLTDPYGTNAPTPYITNAGYQLKVNIGFNNNVKTLDVYNGVTTYNGCKVTASILYTKTTD